MKALTRRDLLQRGGAGMLLMSGLTAATASAAAGGALTAAETETATQLVAALGLQPALAVDAAAAQKFAGDLSAYCVDHAEARPELARLLDDLRRQKLVTGSSAAGDLKALQSALSAPGSRPGTANGERARTVGEAVEVARAYFGFGQYPAPELLLSGVAR